jgi:hypothetical protein
LSTLPAMKRVRLDTPFRSALAWAARTATGSISTPTASEPRSAAAMAKIPDPAPTSSTAAPGWAAKHASKSPSATRVVGCAPEPNAGVGSTLTQAGRWSPGRGAQIG